MATDRESAHEKHGKHPKASPGDRARKSVLGTAAGAVPLAISLLLGSGGGGAPARPAARALRAGGAPVVFAPGCSMPFQSDPVPEIDTVCKLEGEGKSDAKIAESKAKNDFCVTTSNVTPIQYQTFVDLQQKTHFGSSADRSPLAGILTHNGVAIGEGSYVEYAGFVLHAQYSNKDSGEAVNCYIPGEPTNDIHIQFVDDPSDEDACDSVTAEMSPHFRPEGWTPDVLNNLPNRLVRIRGPLFFDGSHAPCHDNKRPSPQRKSVWEIHPVYSVDVCKQKGKPCQDWIPLEQWNNIHSNEIENP